MTTHNLGKTLNYEVKEKILMSQSENKNKKNRVNNITMEPCL